MQSRLSHGLRFSLRVQVQVTSSHGHGESRSVGVQVRVRVQCLVSRTRNLNVLVPGPACPARGGAQLECRPPAARQPIFFKFIIKVSKHNVMTRKNMTMNDSFFNRSDQPGPDGASCGSGFPGPAVIAALARIWNRDMHYRNRVFSTYRPVRTGTY